MQKLQPLTFSPLSPEWALIEAPIPNAPEGKYISQIPSPNNLLTAASALEYKYGEHTTEPCGSGPWIQLFNFLKDRQPPIVKAPNIIYNMGEATCMDYLYDYAYRYLDQLRDHNPDSRIIVIAYHAWLHAAEFKARGFETTDPHYFECDIIGMPHEDIEWHNAWHLNDWDWMQANVASKTKGIRATMRTSRGCPHKCGMCPVLQTYGAKMRKYSVDWVIDEIKTLYGYGVRQIGFLDDNLMFNQAWSKDFLNRLIDLKFKGMSFTFEEGLDVPTALHEDLLILLKKARFTHIKLGVETFNNDTLEFIKKPYRDGKLAIKAIELLKKHKLSPVCFICIGFPNDTEESIRADIKTLLDLKVKLRVQILWAYPGVDFQGKGLPTETLKTLQREAMYGSGSVAWRHAPKTCARVEQTLPLEA